MPTVRVSARLVVLLGSIVVFNGCLDADRVGFRVVNEMSAPVRVLYVHGTQETEIITSLLPGESGPVNGFVHRMDLRHAGAGQPRDVTNMWPNVHG